jgi:beta-lactamase regulating signal transducer with metallopeptidase domain
MTHTLLHAGLVNAVLATLLALIVAVLARLFRGRPALVHGLWLLVLLKLLTPPLISLTLPWPSSPPEVVAGSDDETPALSVCPWVLSEGANSSPPPETVGAEHRVESVSDGQVPTVAYASGSSPLVRGGSSGEGFLADLLLSLWLVGALACWSMAALRLWRLSRLLRTVPCATGDIPQRIDCLASRLHLRQRPFAYLVPGVMPPMLLVLGRASRLLLPAPLWERLDAMQRDTLLLHELAHLRRADHRVRWLELLVLGLYWWHPVAW